MGKNKTIKHRCPHCLRTYQLGLDGVGGSCDQCAGIKRDRQGYAWYWYESIHTYQSIETGETRIVARAEAFC